MRKTTEDKAREVEYAEKLRRILGLGGTVYTVLRHVSRSGMSRRIDLYAMDPNGGNPQFLTGWAAAVMGVRWDHEGGGIVVGGCGMDMGFHIVNNLGFALWPEGFKCLGQHHDCPYPGAHHERGEHHGKHSGGYALRHRWI